jgi:hypothetical protein
MSAFRGKADKYERCRISPAVCRRYDRSRPRRCGETMAVKALVAPDNSSSSIGIMANVNPESVIKESNYDNNTLTKQFSVKGVFCP